MGMAFLCIDQTAFLGSANLHCEEKKKALLFGVYILLEVRFDVRSERRHTQVGGVELWEGVGRKDMGKGLI